jgi:hypothetical protein
MSDYDRGPVVHYLVFRGKGPDDDYEYEVKHDPDRCPQAEWGWGRDYDCAIAHEFVNVGIDAFGVGDNELDHAKPGTYVLLYWVETYPGGPWGPTEYSSGLTLGDRVA